MIRWLCVLVAALLSTHATAMDRDALEAVADQQFAPYAKAGAPGVAVIVVEDGQPVLRKAWGNASIEHAVPFTHGTVVRLPYSEAREFIATAAVLMEKDGLLSLDDPVRRHLPQLPAWSAKVTLWDLLNHRSGFADEWATLLLMHDSMANRFDEAQFLQFLSRQPRPEVEPGAGYLYSNSDFGLLKLVLQQAAKQPLSAWMRARMFEPLGMAATRLDDDVSAIVPHKASAYSEAPDGYVRSSPDKTSPGGNYYIASSADDLARWAAALVDPRSDAAWASERLRSKVRTIPSKQEPHRIFGQTELQVAGEDVVLHQGVNGFTWLARVPARRLAIVATTNGNGVAQQVRALLDAMLGASKAASAGSSFLTTRVTMSAADQQRYVGSYLWDDVERWQSERPVRKLSRVAIEDGVLTFHHDGTGMPLVPVGEGLFHVRFSDIGMQFTFSQREDGEIALRVDSDDGYPTIRMHRDAGLGWRPAAGDLARFAGRYHSDFLDYTWTLLPGKDGTLLLRRPTAADAVLVPDGTDTFRFTLQDGYGGFDAWVTFHHEPGGKPTHLTVGFSRLMDHRFDRVAD